MGFSKGYPDANSWECLPLNWLKGFEALLKALGLYDQKGFMTAPSSPGDMCPFWLMWRAYHNLRSHIFMILCFWQVSHLSQSMVNSSTCRASRLMETLHISWSRMGLLMLNVPHIQFCVFSWMLVSGGKRGNLRIIVEWDLHVMCSYFSLITTSYFLGPHLTVFLHVWGQLKFSENFTLCQHRFYLMHSS